MSLPPPQIRAILSLLADEDEEIASKIRAKLFELGAETTREVLQAAEPGSPAHREASRVLHLFREPPLEDQIRILRQKYGGDLDLEEGALTLAKFGYPDVRGERYSAILDRMAAELDPNIAPDDHPIRIIRTLNAYLFDRQSFRGQRNLAPDNSYLNRVIERKSGLPIALSAIYIFLARRLDLPIVGVNLPMHFIIKYKSGEEQDILIDPFHRGRVLTPNECGEMIGREITPEFLAEPTDREILIRMTLNLINAYADRRERVERLSGILRILQE